jgi:hypothetical protein
LPQHPAKMGCCAREMQPKMRAADPAAAALPGARA